MATLTSGIDADVETISVTGDVSQAETGLLYSLDDEIIILRSFGRTDESPFRAPRGYIDRTRWTVTRGAEGSTKAAHDAGTPILGVADAFVEGVDVTPPEPLTTDGPGGGAPTDANYLVGTANGSLSNEIVVGTSPGGELGGTWASPTVGVTHSGSSHAGVISAHEAAGDPHTGYRLESADHSHQSTGLQGGKIDHGAALDGLADDDHTQYVLRSILTTRGDLYRRGAAAIERVGLGTTGQALVSDGTDAVWGKPGFIGAKAYATSTQSVTLNIETPVTFDSEEFDTDGFHEGVTNPSRFTIPSGKAGKYRLQAGGLLNVAGGEVEFRKNGDTYIRGSGSGASSGHSLQNHSAIEDLAVGDYVEMIVYLPSSVSIGHASLRQSQMTMSIEYLGA